MVGDVINIDVQRSTSGSGSGVSAAGDDGPFSQSGSPTWNVFNSTSGGSNLALNDSAGNATALTFSATASDAWRNASWSSAEPNRVVYDYWNMGGGNPLPFSIANVPVGIYDLYVVANVAEWSPSAEGQSTITVMGVDKVLNWTTSSGDLPSAGGWVEGTNYVKFTNITLESAGTILGSVSQIVRSDTGGNGGAYLNGMQLVVVPEPSSLILVALGLLSLLRRRR